jgi:hypothetical protein
VQFHPEITRPILEEWFSVAPEEIPGSPEEFLAEFDRHREEWETFGRSLCVNFVDAAERVAVTA